MSENVPDQRGTEPDEATPQTLGKIRQSAARRFVREGRSALVQMESELRALVKGCEEILGRKRDPVPADLVAIEHALRSPSFGKMRTQAAYNETRQTAPEVLFERNLIKVAAAEAWFNQMPVWSGLNGSGNTAHVDLVYRRQADELCLIELKIGSNDLAYAFAEVISYAIGIEFGRVLRQAREKIGGAALPAPVVLDARKLTCVALTPREFRLGESTESAEPEVVRRWCGEANAYLADLAERTAQGQVQMTVEWWRMDISDPGDAEVALRKEWLEGLGILADIVANAERSAVRAS